MESQRRCVRHCFLCAGIGSVLASPQVWVSKAIAEGKRCIGTPLLGMWDCKVYRRSRHPTVACMDSCLPLNPCYFPSGRPSAHKLAHLYSFHFGFCCDGSGETCPFLQGNCCLILTPHPGKCFGGWGRKTWECLYSRTRLAYLESCVGCL